MNSLLNGQYKIYTIIMRVNLYDGSTIDQYVVSAHFPILLKVERSYAFRRRIFGTPRQ